MAGSVLSIYTGAQQLTSEPEEGDNSAAPPESDQEESGGAEAPHPSFTPQDRAPPSVPPITHPYLQALAHQGNGGKPSPPSLSSKSTSSSASSRSSDSSASLATTHNQFCTLDNNNAPKWSVIDAAKWKTYGGAQYLTNYKKSWITYNRDNILSAAKENHIPADLLACVIFNEVGGDPPAIKSGIVLPARQHIPGMKSPMQTSEGAIKIQLQAALSTLGRNLKNLDTQQQNELTACLETDKFNIDAVSKLLHKLILFDYPNADTENLNDEQFAVAGCRYNRGTARPLQDFLQSLKDPPGAPDRVYSSYGRAMLEHRAEIKALLKV